MASEQDLFGYNFQGYDFTPYVRGNRSPYDLDAMPYVRGSTPPYDLADLNSRRPTEALNMTDSVTNVLSGTVDSADDLSDFFDFDIEVEKISDLPGNVPALQGSFYFINSGEGEESRDSPSNAGRHPAPAVNLGQAERDLSPPTPHWPGLSPSIDREPTPAPAVNPGQADRDLSPPTPHWPGLSPSTDPEPTPADPRSPDLPDSYDITTQLPPVAPPFHEEPEAPDPKSPRKVFPSMNDTTNVLTQDQNKSSDITSFSLRPQHSLETQTATQQQTLSALPPWSCNAMTTPQKQDYLEELIGSSIDAGASGDLSLPTKATALCASSPPALQAPFPSSPSTWINIAPSPAYTSKASPIGGSSAFVDDGISASFQAPVLSSPSLPEFQDTSPTGLTQMRQSRLRAKEAEENQTRTSRAESTTNLEEGIDIENYRFKSPEHHSFYKGSYQNLAGHHRVPSAFQNSSSENFQSTNPGYPSFTTYNGPANVNNLDDSNYRSPYPSISRATSVQPTYPHEAQSMLPNNLSSSAGSNLIFNPSLNPRSSPGFNTQNAHRPYFRGSQPMYPQYPSSNPNSNPNLNHTFHTGFRNYQAISSRGPQPMPSEYSGLSPNFNQTFSTAFNPRNVDVRNPAIAQNAPPPQLQRQSSSSDSLRVFPPTPVGATPPQFVLSSNDFAHPSPNYLAGVSLSLFFPFRPSHFLKYIPL